MSLIHTSSPHARATTSTGRVMGWVLLATLPGIATLTGFFGWGVLINVLFAAGLGVGLEALVLRLRARPPGVTLRDNSALVSGVLLGVSLPPFAPWWLILMGMVAAIVVAKQLFGGLGQNPFNPAMVGYALLLIAFPVEMTRWAAPLGLFGAEAIGPGEAWGHFLGTVAPSDAMTGATPLDAFKHKGETVLASEFWADEPLPPGTLNAWHTTALAWLVGGALLLFKRIISWHIPASLLGALLVLATLMYASDPSHHGSPLFHLLGGAAIFGAFFIATDPVSAATSRKGKLYYGAAIGVLIMLIRQWGAYPDAVAFAVLLLNFAVPFIDYYTRPRTYGHARPNRGIKVRQIDDDEEAS
ncbi:electron transport complex protein RnfD [Modicisalibacter ilicicola DSM 19980]|uniref:Ion-translocating oxidoreductase complex subunit D n=1 Tax=Modicisalibacter ilicicola DSM 19980 TaxID=1121942 RepID=A0A1M4ZAY1_9GAMM|nr:RnfABCDGE type electron transport complex subunit D [Halomonas ilicicola]SHF15145.1 electron transport complex protein RnfD [Halomonas ilicicola DSM 19980]